MPLERNETVAERVFIPPTDDDEDSANQTSTLEPTHNQPTASRYMHRLLRIYQTPDLKGPDSFHTLTHWFALYVYAVNGHDGTYRHGKANMTISEPSTVHKRDKPTRIQLTPDQRLKLQELKKLQNICIDTIRNYYRDHGATPSAFRIETLYKAVPAHEGMRMKTFLLETVAWRITYGKPSRGFKDKSAETATGCENGNTGFSPSIETMLLKNPDIAAQLEKTLLRMLKGPQEDPRVGKPEKWHIEEEMGDLDSNDVADVDKTSDLDANDVAGEKHSGNGKGRMRSNEDGGGGCRC